MIFRDLKTILRFLVGIFLGYSNVILLSISAPRDFAQNYNKIYFQQGAF